MKRVILILLGFCYLNMAFAQQKELTEKIQKEKVGLVSSKGVSSIPKCFCCDNAYTLPVPAIKGPAKTNCDDTLKFSTPDCPGATFSWSISPAATTQQAGNTFTVYPPIAPGTYTVTLSLLCGKQKVTNTYKFTIEKPQACNPQFSFTYRDLPNGNIEFTTVPDPSTQMPGVEHWWGIQGNGNLPNCNPCAAIPFEDFTSSPTKVWGGYINPAGVLTPYMGTGITKGPSGYGISYGGMPSSGCFRITHYIKCCGQLYRFTRCVKFESTQGMKLRPKPVVIETAVEYVGHVTLLK
jgi:hypothetical protein